MSVATLCKDHSVVIAGASCTLDVAITIPDCMQLLSCMQVIVATTINAVQAAVLCSQTKTVGAGYAHRRLSNTMSTCTIWMRARLNTSSSMMQAACKG